MSLPLDGGGEERVEIYPIAQTQAFPCDFPLDIMFFV
jgi:hypothetical protein